MHEGSHVWNWTGANKLTSKNNYKQRAVVSSEISINITANQNTVYRIAQ